LVLDPQKIFQPFYMLSGTLKVKKGHSVEKDAPSTSAWRTIELLLFRQFGVSSHLAEYFLFLIHPFSRCNFVSRQTFFS